MCDTITYGTSYASGEDDGSAPDTFADDLFQLQQASVFDGVA